MKYDTSDVVLAAYLVTIGYKVDSISIIELNKGIFHFKHVDESVIDNYMLAKGSVEPIKFNTNLKQLVTAVRQKCR